MIFIYKEQKIKQISKMVFNSNSYNSNDSHPSYFDGGNSYAPFFDSGGGIDI